MYFFVVQSELLVPIISILEFLCRYGRGVCHQLTVFCGELKGSHQLSRLEWCHVQFVIAADGVTEE